MRLPSIDQIIAEGKRTCLRFPLAVIAAFLATVAGLILIDYEGPGEQTVLFPILLASVLGFFLLSALALTTEKMRKSGSKTAIVQAIGAILIIAYGFAVPTDLPKAPTSHIVQFVMLLIGLCFFLMVAPYWRKGETNGFWQYNKTIFLRALMSVLFAGVLFAGLAIALAALDHLFGVHISGKRYGELWIAVAGLFATTFFLSGIPENLDSLESTTDYPKGLRIFAQYVLMSLVVVYFVILYAYIAKILFQWNWPKGWVAELILGFTVTGVISLVLLFPMREQNGYGWLKRVWTWYYILLIPLTVVLFLAINRRISDYGVTEERYLVFAFGVWLVAMIVYFLAGRARSIKIIPATLCFMALALSFGPWGAFGVSESSQVSRLEGLLSKNEILVDGKVQKAPEKVPVEDARQISSIVAYLRNTHGLEVIQPWFAESLRADSSERNSRYKDEVAVTAAMGLANYPHWRTSDYSSVYLSADGSIDVDISGYERAVLQAYFNADRHYRTMGEMRCMASEPMDTFFCWVQRDSSSTDTVIIPIRSVIDSLAGGEQAGRRVEIPPE
ncbi:hypothetical protein C3F09_08165, partial [candidate division GN15 bacterium]